LLAGLGGERLAGRLLGRLDDRLLDDGGRLDAGEAQRAEVDVGGGLRRRGGGLDRLVGGQGGGLLADLLGEGEERGGGRRRAHAGLGAQGARRGLGLRGGGGGAQRRDEQPGGGDGRGAGELAGQAARGAVAPRGAWGHLVPLHRLRGELSGAGWRCPGRR